MPQISMRVHAFFVSDDNGARPAAISSAQVQSWVDRANEVFAGAAIHLDFNPAAGGGDWQAINSTLINSMAGTSDTNWTQERDAANNWAKLYPSDMAVFFRYGPG